MGGCRGEVVLGLLARAVAGNGARPLVVEVVHEQRGHDRPRRRGLERLHVDDVGTPVGRREDAVLRDRPGPGRRRHVHRAEVAVLPGHQRPPPLEALGQRVVRTLLEDEAVGDAELPAVLGGDRVAEVRDEGAAARHGVEAAAHQAQQARLLAATPRVLDRGVGHGEHVRRGRQVGQRDVVALALQRHDDRVGTHRDPDEVRTVRVGVVADRHRTVERPQPRADRGRLADQVAAVTAVGAHRDVERPGPGAGEPLQPLPHALDRNVHREHLGPVLQQPLGRAHLRAGPEQRERPAAQVQPLGSRHHARHRVDERRLDDPVVGPPCGLVDDLVAAQVTTPVGDDELLDACLAAVDGAGVERGRGRGRHRLVDRSLGPVLVDDDERVVQTVEAGAGDGGRIRSTFGGAGRQRPQVVGVGHVPPLLVRDRLGQGFVDAGDRVGDHVP